MNRTFYSCITTLTAAIAYSPAAADLTPAEVRLLAVELGATPDTLTAAGFTLSTALQALARLAEQEQTASTLRQHQAQVTTLHATLKSLNAEARAASSADEAQRIESELSTVRAGIDTAVALAESARAQLVTALIGPSADFALTERVFSPSLVPAAYRVVELTEDQLSELGSALSAERHAQVRGQTPSAQVQQTLASFRSMPAISMALGSQTAHLESVRQLFLITE